MLTKEDLTAIKEIVDERISKVEERMSTKKDLADVQERMDARMDEMEEKMTDMRKDISELRDSSHKKFILIENEVIPKISALYETTDLYVKEMECWKRREKADEKMDSIEPLKVMVKSHSDRLAKHDEMLEKIVTNVG